MKGGKGQAHCLYGLPWCNTHQLSSSWQHYQLLMLPKPCPEIRRIEAQKMWDAVQLVPRSSFWPMEDVYTYPPEYIREHYICEHFAADLGCFPETFNCLGIDNVLTHADHDSITLYPNSGGRNYA